MMNQASDQPWDWIGQAPAPLPEDLKDIGTETLVLACQSMEDRLQRMTLLVEAMRVLLQDAGLFSESVLREAMDTIDLRDGALDGRSTKPFLKICTSCGATTSGSRRFCQSCGSEALSAVS
jgi:hypothetical protein